MALNIETFSNRTGGSSLFKALSHPEAAAAAGPLLARLRGAGPVAIYDPLGQLATFLALYDIEAVQVTDVFVQDVEEIGRVLLDRPTRPVTELPSADFATLFVTAFDSARLVDQIRHLMPEDVEVVSLDQMRIPEDLLTNRRSYLAPLNFATNFAFFRDAEGHHTRVVTANYWSGYGATDPHVWATLFDEAGKRLATWRDPLPGAHASIVIDSAEVRRRFDLPAFTGQLFVHIVGAAGHDVVKYALDTYGDDASVLSCTHDANAWPADYYAGLPAPRDDETVVLWVQNSHPRAIPPGGVAVNLMGDDAVAPLDRAVPGFGTYRLDVAELLPAARWPQQVEVEAGKHFVRPRYEIWRGNGRQHIAHMNVERVDLEPDPRLPEIGNVVGKGFVLPAPILPPERFRTFCLPTPMSRRLKALPIAAILHDADGTEVARHRFGVLRRRDSTALDVTDLLAQAGVRLDERGGHVELVYDFDGSVEGGREADGWLHAIFRYQDRSSGHEAETSFGSHIFNTVLTYRNEPQSYAGRPPGLSTRLFLRVGPADTETFCHLIYSASTPWHPHSATRLVLTDRDGHPVVERTVQIPCGGSLLFRVRHSFSEAELAAAGPDCYVLIRDLTCRLFGYHGLMHEDDGAFSLDHMFGF